MFINTQLQTCNIQIPGSVPLTDDLAAKLKQYAPCGKAVLDESGNLIDIEYDEEKAAKVATEQAEETLQYNLKQVQEERSRYLQAFNTYKSNLIYFGDEETEEEHEEITEWYNALLTITDGVTAEEIPEFPEVPASIQKYL